MIVLGVDPGTAFTGAGILRFHASKVEAIGWEVFSPPMKSSRVEKLFLIHRFLVKQILQFKPEVMALENVFFGQNAQTMIRIGEVRACAMLAAREYGLALEEYPPAKIKIAVTGNGKATKTQVQHMIQQLLGLETLPLPDAADALAVALCHVYSTKSSKLVISK